MTIKEKVQIEVDKLPDELLEQVDEFISSIMTRKKKKVALHTFKLKGKFDSINIREEAYE